MPPASAFNDEITIIRLDFHFGMIINNIINSGAIFCHVDKSKQLSHLTNSIVIGYQ